MAESPNLPARGSAGYSLAGHTSLFPRRFRDAKVHHRRGDEGMSVPRRFFNSSLNPFFPPFPLLHDRRATGLGEPHLSLLGLCYPQKNTNAASEKNALSRLPALICWPPRQYSLADHQGRGSALRNEADEVPGCPGSPATCSRDCFRCSITATFL
jgi:hypothetical protein